MAANNKTPCTILIGFLYGLNIFLKGLKEYVEFSKSQPTPATLADGNNLLVSLELSGRLLQIRRSNEFSERIQ